MIYVERKNGIVKLIFPKPREYRLNTYHVSKRKTYTVMEPVDIQPTVITIGSTTAKQLVDGLKADGYTGEATVWDNDNWHMRLVKRV